MEQARYLLPIIYLFVGGAVTLMIKIVFDWLKKQKNGPCGDIMRYIRCPLDRANTIADIKWLKDVHDKSDSSGMPLWYIPRGLEAIMNRVAESTMKQTVLLERLIGQIAANGVRLDTIIKNGNNRK